MYISEEEDDFDFIKIVLHKEDICRHSSIKSLMKYNLDKLKIKCKERNVSMDGSKHELAERIIIIDNNYIKDNISSNEIEHWKQNNKSSSILFTCLKL